MYAIHSTLIYEALTMKDPKKQTSKGKDPIKKPLSLLLEDTSCQSIPKNGEAEAIAAGGQNHGLR